MRSRSFAFSLLLLATLPLVAGAADAQRPNVLWLIAEDFGPELSCYGEPEVSTPNLDALAAKGMRFTQAFTTAPVCSASRSAIMTGMYQTTIGAHHHRSHRSDDYRLPEGVRVLPAWIRDAGYFTGNIVQLTDDPKEKFYRGTGKTDWNFNITEEPFQTKNWSDLKQNQPFYAQINFSETHRGGAWNSAHKHIDKTADPDKVVIPPYYPDHPLVRADWAQYLNTAMALDKKIGFVLNNLKEDGLHDNTIVFFFGDHGRAMPRGKQWPYDSGLHIPLIVYWPKTLGSPKGYQAGSVNDALIEAIDFAPTALEIAGAPVPEKMQGKIMFGPKADQSRKIAFAARDRCDATGYRIRTARTDRYRYLRNFHNERPFLMISYYKETQYPTIPLIRSLFNQGKLNEVQARLAAPGPRPKEELYDIENDPYEIHNLADSPEHQDTLARLRSATEQWIEQSDDQGRFEESPEVIRAMIEESKQKYAPQMKKLAEQYPDVYPLPEAYLLETWMLPEGGGTRGKGGGPRGKGEGTRGKRK